jgi:hypothetical protein
MMLQIVKSKKFFLIDAINTQIIRNFAQKKGK